MTPGPLHVITSVLLALTGPAAAACPQELAIYHEAESGAGIEFQPLDQTQPTTANAFKVIFARTDLVLDGAVIWNNGVSRPNAIVLHDCPQGDATGEEIDACTIWQGVIYSVSADGTVDLMPSEGDAAAEQLLLPDFGRTVRYSVLFPEKTESIPWDVFKLSGCQE